MDHDQLLKVLKECPESGFFGDDTLSPQLLDFEQAKSSAIKLVTKINLLSRQLLPSIESVGSEFEASKLDISQSISKIVVIEHIHVSTGAENSVEEVKGARSELGERLRKLKNGSRFLEQAAEGEAYLLKTAILAKIQRDAKAFQERSQKAKPLPNSDLHALQPFIWRDLSS